MLTVDEAGAYLDSLAKPVGSLGRLEWLAARLCRVQQTLHPQTMPRRVVVFAADHGAAASGVSAWPSAITEAMVRAIVDGVAASSVLAAATQTDLRLVDVGTFGPDLGERAGYACRKVCEGSRDLCSEPALTVEELQRAWGTGAAEANAAAEAGFRVVAAGEVGIGNTTPASCLTVLLTDVPVSRAVGRGAGADDETLARKTAAVAAAVERARPWLAADPERAIAAVSGLEIAAMAGFYARAAERRLTIVLDGFVTTSAALIAERLRPGTCTQMIAAHRSAEPGHGLALEHLGLEPVLDGWQMRLGEGTAAVLAMPLLDAAAAVVGQMATLADLGAGA